MISKIKQTLTGIVLASASGLATASPATANPVETKPYEFQLEKGYTDECTSETEFYDGEIGICNEDLKDYSKSIIPKSYLSKLENKEKLRGQELPIGRCSFVYYLQGKIRDSIKDEEFSVWDLEKVSILIGAYLRNNQEIENRGKIFGNILYITQKKIIDEQILTKYPFLIEDKKQTEGINLSYPAYKELSEEEFSILKNLGYVVGKNKLTLEDFVVIYQNLKSNLKKQEDWEDKSCGISDEFLEKSRNLFLENLVATNEYQDHQFLKDRISMSIIELFNPALFSDIGFGNKQKIDSSVRKILNVKEDKDKLLVNYNLEKDRPIPMRLPPWTLLLSIPAGIFGPFVRHKVMKKWTKRETDAFDLTELVVGTFIGAIIADSIPWVYPVRMIAPLFFEPVRKALGWKTRSN